MRPVTSTWIRMAATAAILLACGGPASAQLLGGGPAGIVRGAPGGLTGGLTGDLSRPLSETLTATGGTLAEIRRQTVERLIREHPEAVEADAQGAPVVRGEVLALSPSGQALANASAAGFRLGARTSAPELGLDSVTLLAPPGLSAREALRRLRRLAPQGQYDLDHIYQEGGAVAGAAGPAGSATGRNIRVGLVDGSVDASHPAFRASRFTQQAFAPGGPKVTAHATAVASLLAGSDGAFRGAAPGSEVLVADVYGTTAAGGSASAIAQGLAWLARNRVGVINISLVGPPNLVLGAAVRGLTARGFLLVAAVGNDGPAAPPLYPAAYPGVIAVTGVDARRRVLPEAGRGPQVVFAAPGAEMAAATPGGGFAVVRGTSFAAPLVAGALAEELPAPDPEAAAAAVRRLAAGAQDLGARGRDPVFGFGLVAFDRRTDPARVAARAPPLRGP